MHLAPLITKGGYEMALTFEYPFLYFGNIGVKPSLIMLGVFVVFEVVVFFMSHRVSEKKSIPFLLRYNLSELSYSTKYRLAFGALVLIVLGFAGVFNITIVEGGLFYNIAKGYLESETVVSIVVLISAFCSLMIKSNRDKYINVINSVAVITIFMSLSSMLLTRQVMMTESYNLQVYIFVIIILGALSLVKLKPSNQNESGRDYHQPIVKYDDLCPAQQLQADEIMGRIKYTPVSALSICVSGAWGAGKTSVVSGALNKLVDVSKKAEDDEPKATYCIININALEIDTVDSLFVYLFSQIKNWLKQQGAYVGIASEYENFIVSSMGVITHNTIGALLAKTLFPSNDDYRTRKQALEKLLSKALDKGKIIVVVDDIERCDSKKAKEFIFFIKEIATLPNCIAVFITDYEYLVNNTLVRNDSKFDTFYEKFFNCRINITEVPFFELVAFFEKDDFLDVNLLYDEYKKPSEVVKDVERLLQGKACLNQFRGLLNNPRTLMKIYDVYRKYCDIINKRYITNFDDVKAYFGRINLSGILFLLSYIEACLPYELEQMRTKGVNNYLANLFAKPKNNDNNEAISIMATEYFNKVTPYSTKPTYYQLNARKFLQALVRNNADLTIIVNGFTSQEEEWFDAIEKDRIDSTGKYWVDLTVSVLGNFDELNKHGGKGSLYLDKLFKYVSETTSIKKDCRAPFRLFERLCERLESVQSYGGFYLRGVYFLKQFYECFCIESHDYSRTVKENLSDFSALLRRTRINEVTNAIDFLVDEVHINEFHESVRIYCVGDEVINAFVKVIGRFVNFSDKPLSGETSLDKLDDLICRLEEFLYDNGLSEYQDMKQYIEDLKKPLSDLRYLDAIVESVNNAPIKESDADTPKFDITNLSAAIEYFERTLNNSSEKSSKEFSDFFRGLPLDTDGIVVTKEQVEKLHILIEKFWKRAPQSIVAVSFRKKLLAYSKLLEVS